MSLSTKDLYRELFIKSTAEYAKAPQEYQDFMRQKTMPENASYHTEVSDKAFVEADQDKDGLLNEEEHHTYMRVQFETWKKDSGCPEFQWDKELWKEAFTCNQVSKVGYVSREDFHATGQWVYELFSEFQNFQQ